MPTDEKLIFLFIVVVFLPLGQLLARGRRGRNLPLTSRFNRLRLLLARCSFELRIVVVVQFFIFLPKQLPLRSRAAQHSASQRRRKPARVAAMEASEESEKRPALEFISVQGVTFARTSCPSVVTTRAMDSHSSASQWLAELELAVPCCCCRRRRPAVSIKRTLFPLGAPLSGHSDVVTLVKALLAPRSLPPMRL